MPRRSKHIAARQAALAKKKKKSGPRPAVIYRQPESPTVTQAEVMAAPPASAPSAEVPDFEVPVRAEAAPAVTTAPRGGLPASPYLSGDLARIGKLAAVLAVVLIVLAFVLG